MMLYMKINICTSKIKQGYTFAITPSTLSYTYFYEMLCSAIYTCYDEGLFCVKEFRFKLSIPQFISLFQFYTYISLVFERLTNIAIYSLDLKRLAMEISCLVSM